MILTGYSFEIMTLSIIKSIAFCQPALSLVQLAHFITYRRPITSTWEACFLSSIKKSFSKSSTFRNSNQILHLILYSTFFSICEALLGGSMLHAPWSLRYFTYISIHYATPSAVVCSMGSWQVQCITIKNKSKFTDFNKGILHVDLSVSARGHC